MSHIDDGKALLAELAAQNAMMRDVLNAVECGEFNGISCNDIGGLNWFDVRKQALSLPQPAALREIEARLLDELVEMATDAWNYKLARDLKELAAAKREQTT